MYLSIFWLSCFFLFWCFKFPFISFLFREPPNAFFSSTVGLLVTNSLEISFFHLRMSWFPLHVWKIFLSGIGFWVGSSFSQFLLAFMVTDDKSAIIWMAFPLHRLGIMFLWLLFNIFFFSSLVFRDLIMVCPDVDFFGFILYGVCSVSWAYRFMSLGQM